MLPKTIRNAYYWIGRQGKIGFIGVQIINRGFMAAVKILGLRARQDKTCLTIISHKYQFIYIGIPKTATRSMMNEFTKPHYESTWYETPADFARVIQAHPDYFTFTFTRNPYARALSCYHSKIKDAVPGKQARIMSFYRHLHPRMSFEDFAEWLNSPEGADEFADRHWLSQHILLSGPDGQLVCDFVGQYETLAEGLKMLQQKLDLPYAIELEQRGHISGTGDYRESYNGRSKKLIEQRYQTDFEVFGYERDV